MGKEDGWDLFCESLSLKGCNETWFIYGCKCGCSCEGKNNNKKLRGSGFCEFISRFLSRMEWQREVLIRRGFGKEEKYLMKVKAVKEGKEQICNGVTA